MKLRSALPVLAIAACLSVVGCKKNEPAPVVAPVPAPAPTTPAPAAPAAVVSVQSVNIGTSAGADKSVASQSVISAADAIIVSVRTEGTASNVPVVARLTYQDGQVAGEQTAQLNTSGPHITNITFRNDRPWPAGKYNVHVTVDGRTVGLAQQVEVR